MDIMANNLGVHLTPSLGLKCARLLTLASNPQPMAEQRYNKTHWRTRSVVERVLGIWKIFDIQIDLDFHPNTAVLLLF